MEFMSSQVQVEFMDFLKSRRQESRDPKLSTQSVSVETGIQRTESLNMPTEIRVLIVESPWPLTESGCRGGCEPEGTG